MVLSEKRTKKAMRNSIKDGAAFAAADGINSTYSTPFALALGASNAQIGILNSAPSLLMSISQYIARRFVYGKDSKKVTLLFAILQRLVWLPVILIPFFFLESGLWLFIVLFSLSGTLLSIANTSWSCWIGDIVPEKIRGSFFGNRTMIQSITSFLVTLVAGYILGMIDGVASFSIIFSMAFAFGIVSYLYQKKIPENKLEFHGRGANKLNVLGFVREMRKYRNFLPFTVHMSFLYFAVSLASPFFTVYMLSVMNVGYEWYALIVASEIMSRVLMLRYWGKMSDKFGDRNIMYLCNVLIVFYPILFLLSKTPFHLVLVSVFSGFSWSGFDLTTFNYLLDVTPPGDRQNHIANYKIAIGIAFFLGPMIGGYLSQGLSGDLMGLDGLQIIFLLSFILRLLASLITMPRLKEARSKRTLPVTNVFVKAFATYPIRGMSHELVYIHRQVGKLEREVKREIRKNLKGIT